MYKSFSISGFRGLSRCSIEGMRRLTLLTGMNNTGKTAALEAMFIHSGHHNPNLVMVVNAVRGVAKIRLDPTSEGDPPWLSVFSGFVDTLPIRLTGEVQVKSGQFETRVMQITSVKSQTELSGLSAQVRGLPYSTDGLTAKILKLELTDGRKKSVKHFMYYDGNQQHVIPTPPLLRYQARFLSPHQRDSMEEQATQFARLQLSGQVDLLLAALREIEPRLRGLELVFNGEPMLHGDIGMKNRRLVPLPYMGDGVSRVAALILAIGSVPGGAVFVDDIDTGLHYSVMQAFWASVMKAADLFDVQVVATTHSGECLKAALLNAEETNSREDLCLVRLERQADHVAAFTYGHDEIEFALGSGLEVR